MQMHNREKENRRIMCVRNKRHNPNAGEKNRRVLSFPNHYRIIIICPTDLMPGTRYTDTLIVMPFWAHTQKEYSRWISSLFRSFRCFFINPCCCWHLVSEQQSGFQVFGRFVITRGLQSLPSATFWGTRGHIEQGPSSWEVSEITPSYCTGLDMAGLHIR